MGKCYMEVRLSETQAPLNIDLVAFIKKSSMRHETPIAHSKQYWPAISVYHHDDTADNRISKHKQRNNRQTSSSASLAR